MSGEYDRHERHEARREVVLIFAGCSIVVLAVIVLFVVYGVWLVRSGWHG